MIDNVSVQFSNDKNKCIGVNLALQGIQADILSVGLNKSMV